MNEITQPIKGMHDYIPSTVIIWQYIENIIKQILKNYCYEEIRFPILENTSLFTHNIGDATDIIEKEMYSFQDKNEKSITLRPEGTIGCMRSCINNGLLRFSEQKLWYLGPMFRYEKPQYGRYRQFHQLGIEVFGLIGPDIDLEIILIMDRILKQLNVFKDIKLELNSIGTYESRLRYAKSLFSYLKKYEKFLDEDCKKRLYINPLRILDSKNKNLSSILKDSPILIDFLDHDSLLHFKNLCELINSVGISYKINYRLIRGLDYYNNTVFEWKSDKLGSKKTICAGGRYDYLSKSLGENYIPAIGCAIGMERLLLLVSTLEIIPKIKLYIDVYIIFLQEDIKLEAIKLSEFIRTAFPKKKIKISFSCRTLKKKFSTANKSGARIVLLLGPNEINNNTILLKDLKYGYQKSLFKNEIVQELKNILR